MSVVTEVWDEVEKMVARLLSCTVRGQLKWEKKGEWEYVAVMKWKGMDVPVRVSFKYDADKDVEDDDFESWEELRIEEWKIYNNTYSCPDEVKVMMNWLYTEVGISAGEPFNHSPYGFAAMCSVRDLGVKDGDD